MAKRTLLALAGLAMLAPQAFAADQPAPRQVRLLFNDTERTWVTGDTVPGDRLLTILFVKEPCPLPIVGREHMRRAWISTGAYQLGCWYPTIDGNYVFVGRIASLTHASGAPFETFPRAQLNADGSATITEQNYNSRTFAAAVLQRLTRRTLENSQQRP